jgi:hypothetical protein
VRGKAKAAKRTESVNFMMSSPNQLPINAGSSKLETGSVFDKSDRHTQADV